ncbi:hypothetical protein C8R43DRAFT_901311, partial [Mycena crocata]
MAVRVRLGLSVHHTVFEGEGVGGCLALFLLLQQPEVRGKVTIAVDSQPAINATKTARSNPSHWIWDEWHRGFNLLIQEHSEIQLTIRWTPGHKDIKGNERADEEAKKAAQDGTTRGVEVPAIFRHWDNIPRSRSALKQA